jgi:hypothetical protein
MAVTATVTSSVSVFSNSGLLGVGYFTVRVLLLFLVLHTSKHQFFAVFRLFHYASLWICSNPVSATGCKLQALGFRDGLILHVCEREGPVAIEMLPLHVCHGVFVDQRCRSVSTYQLQRCQGPSISICLCNGTQKQCRKRIFFFMSHVYSYVSTC